MRALACSYRAMINESDICARCKRDYEPATCCDKCGRPLCDDCWSDDETGSSTTDHNGELTKSTLLPSRRVLNGSDVADWALVAPRAENGTVAKISN